MDAQRQIDELRTRMSILEKMVLLMSQTDDGGVVTRASKKATKAVPKASHPFKQRNIA